jgi:polar amino acid transport system ATP-binding protein
MTCVIVTHEISFARNVSSTIFYMDDHGIYERGTPEALFDNPQREKTRRFIHRLKVLEYESVVDEVDIYEITRRIADYCHKYDLTKTDANTINLVIEELVVHILKHAGRQDRLGVTVSYNENARTKEITVCYTAPEGNVLESPELDEISRRLVTGFTRESACTRAPDGTTTLSLTL